MEIVRSRDGVPVRLTDERWNHIERNHPEVGSLRQEVLETVADPDLIQEGDSGELLAIKGYEATPLTSKNLVVPYRETSVEDRIHPDCLSHEPPLHIEDCKMEALKILEKQENLNWDYDEEADVLYLSVGRLQKALGVDIGEGLVVRMDTAEKEVVGLTVVGLRSRLLKNLPEKGSDAAGSHDG